jgi:hypothetical protein
MAAGGVTSNVEIGPGRLYVASLGTTEPASATAVLPSAWKPVGYTDQGSAFSTALTQSEIDVAEEIDPIRYVLSKRANTLAFAMAEITRRNLALAMGSGAGAVNDATTYEPPDPGTEVAVMIVWDSDLADTPTATNVRYLFRQCKAGGTINLNRNKAPAKALIAVTFNLEKPAGLAPFKVFPNSSGLA